VLAGQYDDVGVEFDVAKAGHATISMCGYMLLSKEEVFLE
jgi:hypothetical protein